jgi:hypothetical protein
VNTTDASMGNPFGEMQVRQIPLQTRNVVELLSVQPGVTSNGEVLGARIKAGRSRRTRANANLRASR